MIKADCHLHTSFSGDSETPMEQMVEQAIHLGLSRICFTEHLDWDYKPSSGNGPDNPFSLDIPAYWSTLKEQQARYRSQIEIRFGIELGMIASGYDAYHALLQEYPFDFTIASSHLVDGFDPYYPDFWQSDRWEENPENLSDSFDSSDFPGSSFGQSKTQCAIRRYFTSTLEHLNAYPEFDTYAHLDYIVRYAPEPHQYAYAEYADCLDAILKRLIELDRALEVNTGGYKYGLGVPNPQPEVLRRYRELGGERITIGSDAHAPEHIAFDFKRCQELLLSLGFRYYAVYDKHQPKMWPL